MAATAGAIDEQALVDATIERLASAGDEGLVARHEVTDHASRTVDLNRHEDVDRLTISVLEHLEASGIAERSVERRYDLGSGLDTGLERWKLTALGEQLARLKGEPSS